MQSGGDDDEGSIVVSCEGREYMKIYMKNLREKVKAGEALHEWAERLSRLEGSFLMRVFTLSSTFPLGWMIAQVGGRREGFD